MRGRWNDWLRSWISLAIGWSAFGFRAIHLFRTATFFSTQKRLRRRYRITADTPILPYGPELERHIRDAAARHGEDGIEAAYALTSGSTAAPKRILYTKSRLRSVRWMFMDLFVRCLCAYGVRRKSLYVFSAFGTDHSLTSMLREEKKLPSYLVTLQAPYRVERHDAIQDLARRYGAVAVQFWILTMSNPGLLYCTNPSTLWLFLHEIATNWRHNSRLIRDFQSRPDCFNRAVHDVARRLESAGCADRLAHIASANEPLPLSRWAPAVRAYVCWTGGYVKPFLDRIAQFLPPTLYQLIPMFSMSTETIETAGHFVRNTTVFLPLAKGVLYEFIEEGSTDSPENLKTAAQLRPMTAYTMVVSDRYGLRRYQTEDVFLCNGFAGKLPDLRFLRRRNLEYSFTGEKLTAQQLALAFERLHEEFAGLGPRDFLTCVPSDLQANPLPHYMLVLTRDAERDGPLSVEAIAARCDALLQELNAEYGNKRRSGRLGMLGIVQVTFSDFFARFGAENQFKFLPLYRCYWKELIRQPAGMLCK